MSRFAAAVVTVALAASGVGAQGINVSGWTGNQLVKTCEAPRGANHEICKAYILGVADTLAWDGDVCRPSEATGNQLTAVVKAYLNKRPADWHLHASFLAGNALRLAFPCSKAIRK
jgi:hypothetical protein